MAISATHFELLKLLKSRGELTQRGSILEIGEANVYGDFDASEIGGSEEIKNVFGLAKAIYLALFNVTEIVSIDAGGPNALNLDLNAVIKLDEQFDTCINHGTAEHIFDIGNVFRTMHDNTKIGGLMIHESPFTGWVDHGFYCLQPTLFWDVAAANRYDMVLCATEHLASKTYALISSREQILELKRCDRLADNLMLFVVMRKTAGAPFVVPMQGVYTGSISDNAQRAWTELR